MNSAKLDLIQKIRRLSQSGVGGEKTNAEAMLRRLMDKYFICEEDLSDERSETRIFSARNKAEEMIVVQTIASVYDGEIYGIRGKRRATAVSCTTAEYLEIRYAVDFYLRHYRREAKLFTDAFVSRNHLYPRVKRSDSVDISSRLSEEDLRAVHSIASGLSRHERLRAIEG